MIWHKCPPAFFNLFFCVFKNLISAELFIDCVFRTSAFLPDWVLLGYIRGSPVETAFGWSDWKISLIFFCCTELLKMTREMVLLPLCLLKVCCHISAYAATGYIAWVDRTTLFLKRKERFSDFALTSATNVLNPHCGKVSRKKCDNFAKMHKMHKLRRHKCSVLMPVALCVWMRAGTSLCLKCMSTISWVHISEGTGASKQRWAEDAAKTRDWGLSRGWFLHVFSSNELQIVFNQAHSDEYFNQFCY